MKEVCNGTVCIMPRMDIGRVQSSGYVEQRRDKTCKCGPLGSLRIPPVLDIIGEIYECLPLGL
jgi:hypothetical protein